MFKLDLTKKELEVIYNIRCERGEEDSASDIERLMMKKGFCENDYSEQTVGNIVGAYIGDSCSKYEDSYDMYEVVSDELKKIIHNYYNYNSSYFKRKIKQIIKGIENKVVRSNKSEKKTN